MVIIKCYPKLVEFIWITAPSSPLEMKLQELCWAQRHRTSNHLRTVVNISNTINTSLILCCWQVCKSIYFLNPRPNMFFLLLISFFFLLSSLFQFLVLSKADIFINKLRSLSRLFPPPAHLDRRTNTTRRTSALTSSFSFILPHSDLLQLCLSCRRNFTRVCQVVASAER